MNEFTPENDMFTRRAHEKAYPLVYQQWLPDDYILVDLQGTRADKVADKDFEVVAWNPDLDTPIIFGVQERFRRIKYAKYRDITIAAKDHSKDDLDKQITRTAADFIVFGYYDDGKNELGETVVVNEATLRWLLVTEKVDFDQKTHGSKSVTFVGVPFDDLIEKGACVFHYQPN